MRAGEGARGKPASGIADVLLQFLSYRSQALVARNFQSLLEQRTAASLLWLLCGRCGELATKAYI
jgi:hypothetical protein